VPYQLHCDAHWLGWLLEVLARLDELAGGTLLGAELLGAELPGVLPQTLPVMAGISAVLPFLLP
jgi:hypothetical protein